MIAPLVVLLCGLASARFLFQPGFPYSDDGLNHLVQLASFRFSLAHGDLYPRWSPLLNQQYGSPLFSYYAPLPFYVAEIGAPLGLDVTGSLRLAFALGVLLAGLAMYLLGSELGGPAVGLASGAAFATMPYLLHDVYSRAELGETFALAVLPAALFGFARYARTGARGWLGLAAVFVAALPLAHDISALMDLPFVALWALLMALAAGRGDGARPMRVIFGSILATLALGLGLSAFFWLPAFVERGFVELQRTATPALVRDELLKQPWPPIETSFLFDYRYNLPHQFPFLPGLVQVTLAAAGAVAYAFACPSAPGRWSRLWLLALVPVAGFIVFLHGPHSAWIWGHVPLMSYLQFPYRLLGLFGLITSLFAGFLALALPRGVPRGLGAAAVAIIALAVGLTNLHPSMRGGVPADFDSRSLLVTEAATADLSGAIDDEYLPRWVGSPGAEVIASARPEAQEHATPSPPGPEDSRATVTVVRVAASALDLRVEARRPATIVLRQFFMPQWRATAAGRALPVHPSGPMGLLAIDVPAGDSPVRVEYSRTGLEAMAVGLSLLSPLALVSWFACSGGPGQSRALRRSLVAAAAAAAPIVGLAALGRYAGDHVRQDASSWLPITADTALAPGVRVAGARIDQGALGSEGTLRLVVYLYAQGLPPDLVFWVRAEDGSGNVLGEIRERPWNGATSFWSLGELAPAVLDMPLPAGTLAGDVAISVAAADAASGDMPSGFVSLGRAHTSPVPQRPTHPLYADFEDKLGIQGYRLSMPERDGRVTLRPGQPLVVTLDLQAVNPIFENLKVFVHLVDSKGTVWAQHDDLAGGIQRPMGTWHRGDFVAQEFPLTLPPSAPAGTYRIEVGAYRPDTLRRLRLADAAGSAADAVALGTEVINAAEEP